MRKRRDIWREVKASDTVANLDAVKEVQDLRLQRKQVRVTGTNAPLVMAIDQEVRLVESMEETRLNREKLQTQLETNTLEQIAEDWLR